MLVNRRYAGGFNSINQIFIYGVIFLAGGMEPGGISFKH
jgi:hypothetical protein